jgi:hypothetical protein
MRIELTGPARKRVAGLSDQHGMTQLAIMSRMIEWFSHQSPAVQAAIMTPHLAPDDRETAMRILRDMATSD